MKNRGFCFYKGKVAMVDSIRKRTKRATIKPGESE